MRVCHHAETTSTVYVVKMPRKDAIGHPIAPVDLLAMPDP